MKKVLLVTDVPFWRGEYGSHSRIRELCKSLMDCFEVTVFVYKSLTSIDKKLISGTPFEGHIFSYKDYEKQAAVIDFKSTFESYPSLKKWRFDTYVRSLRYFMMQHESFSVCIVEYIWLSYVQEGIPYKVACILDTHDLMSARQYRFNRQGSVPGVSLTLSQELSLCSRFDVVLAIQYEESKVLSSHLGNKIILTVPFGVDVPERGSVKTWRKDGVLRCGFFGGSSDANFVAIEWFLSQVWPVYSRLKVIRLTIYGRVCDRINQYVLPENVVLAGEVDDVGDVYANCDVMLNPMIHGGGIKIKSVESLCYGIPLISSPEGAVGIIDPENSGVLLCRSRGDFVEVIKVMLDASDQYYDELSVAAVTRAAQQFSSKQCYSGLIGLIGAI